jgi:hypothetical protein
MTVVRTARPAPETAYPTPPPPRRRVLHISDLLLPVSALLWVLGVSRTDISHLGPYGLPAALPIVFYAGVALLVVSVAFELARQSPSTVRMAVHAAGFVVMLYGTAPLVYPEGRYPWLYKTIAVIQYVGQHGSVNPQIDIYQNWPGFFALAAWFDKVAGIGSPLAYAKWAQVFFELGVLPLLYLAYDALALPVRQRWIALFLYAGSNWIGQDYLSPQALGILLSVAILAIALRWMFMGNSSGVRRKRRLPYERSASGQVGRPVRHLRDTLAAFGAIAVLYFVVVVSHQISPYIVATQLAVLVVARLLRPRWVPVALAAIAISYFLPRFGFLENHFGLLSSIGQFLRNVRPPRFDAAQPIPVSEKRLNECADALSIGMWLLAFTGAWVRRRSRRTVLALLVLAFSPVLVLAGVAYGNEAILRVYLFSLPWAAALAAGAVAPSRASEWSGVRLRDLRAGSRRRGKGHRLPAGAVRTPVVLVVILALFFPAFFGGDSFEVMSEAQVNAVTSFLDSAPKGPVFVAVDDSAFPDDARYDEFPIAIIFGHGAITGTDLPKEDIASMLAFMAQRYTNGNRPAYVLVTPSMIAYNKQNPVTHNRSFKILVTSLNNSQTWVKVLSSHGTMIYELPAGLELGPAPPKADLPKGKFFIP